MITLKKITVNKYKSIETSQSVEIDNKITTLVGMNEAGKTAFLEAIAKTNYFTDDKKFKFDKVFDYPRKEKKKLDKSGEIPIVVNATYTISDELVSKIKEDIGDGYTMSNEFTRNTKYDNSHSLEGIKSDLSKFLDQKFKTANITDESIKTSLINSTNITKFNEVLNACPEGDTKQFLLKLKPYFENTNWSNPLSEYIYRVYLSPNLPKFLYYDEFYSLPSRVDIRELQKNNLTEDSLKTSKALLELADINLKEITNATNFEAYVSELEATSNEISQTLFKYWTANKNLRVKFDVDKVHVGHEIHPYLEIRVENLKHMITLPLKNRSKGFNWFFSFIVWFSKIQEDKKSSYILLLDEPGLNLHASAQADFLKFIEELSGTYQIIFTTHSPFMVESDHLERVRTVYEAEEGTVIRDSIQEKDPNTLFPLQAALGYDIAQNLFISKNNLLVEGPADLLYLTILSNILEKEKREGLKEGVTIVPVGGLDKVVTFISLLKASKLNVVCLLDSFIDQKGKQKVEDLVKNKIIKENNIRFFDEFTSIEGGKADIEDLFEKEEYLKLFNDAFSGEYSVQLKNLDVSIHRILAQVNKVIGKNHFNHYRPANKLAQLGVDKSYFSAATLNRFENMFKEINKCFK